MSLLAEIAIKGVCHLRRRHGERILEMARSIGSRSTRERTLRELGQLGVG